MSTDERRADVLNTCLSLIISGEPEHHRPQTPHGQVLRGAVQSDPGLYHFRFVNNGDQRAGLGSILDTVSEDTEDTGPLSIFILSWLIWQRVIILSYLP